MGADIEKFKQGMARAALIVKGDVSKFHRVIHLDLLRRIVLKTPVGNPSLWKSVKEGKRKPPPGYVGGRARGNWQSSVLSVPEGETGKVDASGGSSINQALQVVATLKPFTVTVITNNVPYIERLEDGWSTQAAPGVMIAGSLNEIASIFPSRNDA